MPVSVELRSTDARRVTWTSTARFRASADGVVDLDTSTPTAGDYGGVWGMGLVLALKPRRGLAVYAWDGARPLRFTLRVRSAGKEVASTTFRRRFSLQPLARLRAALDTTGYVGTSQRPCAGSTAGRRSTAGVSSRWGSHAAARRPCCSASATRSSCTV